MNKKSSNKINAGVIDAANLPRPDLNEIRALQNKSDSQIDLSDIPEQDIKAMSQAGTKQIALRVDKDVLEWFRSGGKGYQTIMRIALRRFMKQSLEDGELIELSPAEGKGKSKRYVLRHVG